MNVIEILILKFPSEKMAIVMIDIFAELKK